MEECDQCGYQEENLIEIYTRGETQVWCQSCVNEYCYTCESCEQKTPESENEINEYRICTGENYTVTYTEYLCSQCKDSREQDGDIFVPQRLSEEIVVNQSDEKALYFEASTSDPGIIEIYATTLPKKESRKWKYRIENDSLELPYAGVDHIYGIHGILIDLDTEAARRTIAAIKQAISETELGDIGDTAIITVETNTGEVTASIRYPKTGKEKRLNIKNPRFRNSKLTVRTTISSYHQDKPQIAFLRTAKDRATRDFIGIELETEYRTKGYGDKIAAALQKGRGIFYAEHDSSLTSGAELISHPMSLPYMMQKSTRKNIENMLETIRLDGGMGQASSRAGLHIHVSKPRAGGASHELKANLMWIFTFFEKEMEALSRRKENSYCCYPTSSLRDGLAGIPVKSIVIDKEGLIPSRGRNKAVNFEGNSGATIEFRTFASTTNYEDLLSAAKIAQRTAKFCAAHDVRGATLRQILELDKDPQLMKYTKATFSAAGVSIANINKKVRSEMAIRKEQLFKSEED